MKCGDKIFTGNLLLFHHRHHAFHAGKYNIQVTLKCKLIKSTDIHELYFRDGVLIRRCTCAAARRRADRGQRRARFVIIQLFRPNRHHPVTPVINTYKTVFTKKNLQDIIRLLWIIESRNENIPHKNSVIVNSC